MREEVPCGHRQLATFPFRQQLIEIAPSSIHASEAFLREPVHRPVPTLLPPHATVDRDLANERRREHDPGDQRCPSEAAIRDVPSHEGRETG